MKVPDVLVLDFETHPIQHRPDYPPKPVSCSILMPGWRAPRFLAWGHPSGNNCTYEDAKRVLAAGWGRLPVLCHNGKFDLDVAETHFGLKPLDWSLTHDTQFLLFLCDPYSRNLGLKESAARRLGMAPEERDAVKEWIVEHKAELELAHPEIVTKYGGIKPKSASAFIGYAPANIVQPYCDGDVVRTKKLMEDTYKEVAKRDMMGAYDRERKLMPILLKNEREGIRCDLKRLRATVAQQRNDLETVDAYLRKRLKCGPDVNFGSSPQLVEVLERGGFGENFHLTDKGQKSTSIESLTDAVRDKRLFHTLAFRSRLTNQMNNFLIGWLHQAERTGGTLHTSWNQTKNGDDELSGARTGRLSTDKPLNLLAVTKKLGRKARNAVHPDWIEVAELPYPRSFLLPDEGCVWVRRDFSQQEYRIAAHYEEGALRDAYNESDDTDVHEYVDLKIQSIMGLDLGRDTVKTLNFGMLFGMGLPALALKTGQSTDRCRQLRRAHAVALPDIAEMNEDLKAMGKAGKPIRTWGGREYFCEESRTGPDGRTWDFSYKLLNYLTQGSGADVTKEAIIRYDGHPDRKGRLIGPVHDEMNTNAPKGGEAKESALLRDVMASIELDVPMLSDCEMGESWGTVTKFKDTL